VAFGGSASGWPSRRRRAEEATVAAERRRQLSGAGVV
jgi:hypothetical protein